MEIRKCKCGRFPIVTEFYIKGSANKKHYFVRCNNCKVRTRERKKVDLAIAEWNEHRCELYEKDNKKIINKKEYEDLIWERDYYKLRFEELNKQWERVSDALLGKDYYNMGCDWSTCDIFTANDLIYKYKKKWWQFWRKN